MIRWRSLRDRILFERSQQNADPLGGSTGRYVTASKAVRKRRVWRALIAWGFVACSDHTLRGRVERSEDGKTYLAIMDMNGASCDTVRVDGHAWPHALKAKGAIPPGRHEVACGGSYLVQIDSGKTLLFDYWGP